MVENNELVEGVVYGDLWIIKTPGGVYPYWVCRTGVGQFKPFMSYREAERYVESYPDELDSRP